MTMDWSRFPASTRHASVQELYNAEDIQQHSVIVGRILSILHAVKVPVPLKCIRILEEPPVKEPRENTETVNVYLWNDFAKMELEVGSQIVLNPESVSKSSDGTFQVSLGFSDKHLGSLWVGPLPSRTSEGKQSDQEDLVLEHYLNEESCCIISGWQNTSLMNDTRKSKLLKDLECSDISSFNLTCKVLKVHHMYKYYSVLRVTDGTLFKYPVAYFDGLGFRLISSMDENKYYVDILMVRTDGVQRIQENMLIKLYGVEVKRFKSKSGVYYCFRTPGDLSMFKVLPVRHFKMRQIDAALKLLIKGQKSQILGRNSAGTSKRPYGELPKSDNAMQERRSSSGSSDVDDVVRKKARLKWSERSPLPGNPSVPPVVYDSSTRKRPLRRVRAARQEKISERCTSIPTVSNLEKFAETTTVPQKDRTHNTSKTLFDSQKSPKLDEHCRSTSKGCSSKAPETSAVTQDSSSESSDCDNVIKQSTLAEWLEMNAISGNPSVPPVVHHSSTIKRVLRRLKAARLEKFSETTTVPQNVRTDNASKTLKQSTLAEWLEMIPIPGFSGNPSVPPVVRDGSNSKRPLQRVRAARLEKISEKCINIPRVSNLEKFAETTTVPQKDRTDTASKTLFDSQRSPKLDEHCRSTTKGPSSKAPETSAVVQDSSSSESSDCANVIKQSTLAELREMNAIPGFSGNPSVPQVVRGSSNSKLPLGRLRAARLKTISEMSTGIPRVSNLEKFAEVTTVPQKDPTDTASKTLVDRQKPPKLDEHCRSTSKGCSSKAPEKSAIVQDSSSESSDCDNVINQSTLAEWLEMNAIPGNPSVPPVVHHSSTIKRVLRRLKAARMEKFAETTTVPQNVRTDNASKTLVDCQKPPLFDVNFRSRTRGPSSKATEASVVIQESSSDCDDVVKESTLAEWREMNPLPGFSGNPSVPQVVRWVRAARLETISKLSTGIRRVSNLEKFSETTIVPQKDPTDKDLITCIESIGSQTYEASRLASNRNRDCELQKSPAPIDPSYRVDLDDKSENSSSTMFSENISSSEEYLIDNPLQRYVKDYCRNNQQSPQNECAVTTPANVLYTKGNDELDAVETPVVEGKGAVSCRKHASQASTLNSDDSLNLHISEHSQASNRPGEDFGLGAVEAHDVVGKGAVSFCKHASQASALDSDDSDESLNLHISQPSQASNRPGEEFALGAVAAHDVDGKGAVSFCKHASQASALDSDDSDESLNLHISQPSQASNRPGEDFAVGAVETPVVEGKGAVSFRKHASQASALDSDDSDESLNLHISQPSQASNRPGEDFAVGAVETPVVEGKGAVSFRKHASQASAHDSDESLNLHISQPSQASNRPGEDFALGAVEAHDVEGKGAVSFRKHASQASALDSDDSDESLKSLRISQLPYVSD